MTLSPSCPVCASGSAPLYYAGEHRMYRCECCALAFVHPLPDDEFLARFYSTYHTALAEGGGYEQVEDRMNADFPAKIARLRRQLAAAGIGEGARVLDVGCGKGFFVRACVDAGLAAEGIDLSDTAVAHATGTLGVKATCGRLEDLAGQLGPFDAVTFWATIEHLPHPVETLRAIGRVLKPGGLLLLDTGIGHDWLDRLLPGVNQWYDPPEHLYVFSAEALRLGLEAAGFRLVDLDRNFERNLPRLLARTLRGFVAALALRLAAELGRATGKRGAFNFTRLPMGNLMSGVARKL